jgi:hypothetical protein
MISFETGDRPADPRRSYHVPTREFDSSNLIYEQSGGKHWKSAVDLESAMKTSLLQDHEV